MPLFEWKPEYSVSVKRFDADHKALFSLLNELNDAMAQGQGRFVIGSVLENLLNYTRQHFAAEERAMRMAAYDNIGQHVAEHRALTEQVEKYFTEYNKGETAITIEVLYFLRDWLENHILASDRRYKEPLSLAGIR